MSGVSFSVLYLVFAHTNSSVRDCGWLPPPGGILFKRFSTADVAHRQYESVGAVVNIIIHTHSVSWFGRFGRCDKFHSGWAG